VARAILIPPTDRLDQVTCHVEGALMKPMPAP
jgi:hypothetical protein